jgi:3,4-dihydroxy 2-butanone 4-phosphate synthase/GTP cyclohydrolase II
MTLSCRATATVEDAVAAIRLGGAAVVIDDEQRENEGDLIAAAEFVTPELAAFFVRHSSGLLCVAMMGSRLDDLRMPPMVEENTETMRTAFAVSVDARSNVTTGISAADRATTVRALASTTSMPSDFTRPGHVFPLRYREGGVLKRAGHTEAAVDLAVIAGCQPAGLLAEVTDDDGSMARLPRLLEFSHEHDLPLITIADLVRWRRQRERLVEHIDSAHLPTNHGDFIAHAYRSVLDGVEHLALVRGDLGDGHDVLVRVHSECLTGDTLGSARCDCGAQLNASLSLIDAEGRGVLVYLRGHEGRGIGLAHKVRAYRLQDQGRDTVEANLELGLPIDSREYGIGAQILADLGVREMRLLTNNPAKYGGLAGYDLTIAGRVPLLTPVTKQNSAYLSTKRTKLGHLLDSADFAAGQGLG